MMLKPLSAYASPSLTLTGGGKSSTYKISARKTLAAISIFPSLYMSGLHSRLQKLNWLHGTKPSNSNRTGCQYQNQPSPTENTTDGTASPQMTRSTPTCQPGWMCRPWRPKKVRRSTKGLYSSANKTYLFTCQPRAFLFTRLKERGQALHAPPYVTFHISNQVNYMASTATIFTISLTGAKGIPSTQSLPP